MPMTLAQIDVLLEAAYAAINVGELSFTAPGGRETTFHSLDAFQRWIDWLEGRRKEVLALPASEGGATVSGADGAARVRFVEAS